MDESTWRDGKRGPDARQCRGGSERPRRGESRRGRHLRRQNHPLEIVPGAWAVEPVTGAAAAVDLSERCRSSLWFVVDRGFRSGSGKPVEEEGNVEEE